MVSKMVEVQQVLEVLEELVKEAHLPKIQKPTVSGGCSQEEFNFFKSEWDRYVRSSPGVETTELRDQLFSCPDENTVRSCPPSPW